MKSKQDWREVLMRQDWKSRGYIARGFSVVLLVSGIINLFNSFLGGGFEISVVMFVLAVISWFASYIFLPFKKK